MGIGRYSSDSLEPGGDGLHWRRAVAVCFLCFSTATPDLIDTRTRVCWVP